MRMYDIIRKKRLGEKLSPEEIRFFVNGFTADEIPDYQMSALLMAICLNGMDEEETAVMTDAVAHSGDTVDLSEFGDDTADKHSTGGVGDKTSLIVAPIVASLGVVVAKMSGRGLGHTGGTIDKLESIPGYNVKLSVEQFKQQAKEIGIAMVGQSGNLTPADKKMYALRDVTATVDSIPLIVASIMGKKLAAGAHSIVLDVKFGSGAFMKTVGDAEMLASEMVKIGKRCGRNTAALLTNMDMPLGYAVGNSLEVIEAVSVLRGESRGALREICVALAAAMIVLAKSVSVEEATKLVEESLDSGKAFEKMKEWISAQGGDIAYVEDTSRFAKAPIIREVRSDRGGYITGINAEKIGVVSVALGAGRSFKSEKIDPSAGVILKKTVGDFVEKGEVVFELHTARENAVEGAVAACLSAVNVSQEKPEQMPLVLKVIM